MNLKFGFHIGYVLMHLKPFTLKVIFCLDQAKASFLSISSINMRSVANKVLVSFRKNAWQRLEGPALSIHYPSEHEKDSMHITTLFIQKDIDRAMDRMDDTLKVPLLMSLEGLKYEEISVYLKLPVSTVKNRIRMAQRSLKHRLNEHKQMFS